MQDRGLTISLTVTILLRTPITVNALEDSQGKLEVFPSDNELVLRNFEDGTYKWAYEKDGVFRAESVASDGVRRGVYSVPGPGGELQAQAYISGGDKGHRLVDFGELGIDLPPLPYDLHPKAGQRKFPVIDDEPDEKEKDVNPKLEENVVNSKSHPVQIQPFGTYKQDVDAVVIEAADVTLARHELGEMEGEAVGALAGLAGRREQQGSPSSINYNTNNHFLYNPLVYLRQVQYQPAANLYPVYSPYQSQFLYFSGKRK